MTPPPSDHFNGKTFFNPGAEAGPSFLDLVKWKFLGRSSPWPQSVAIPRSPPPPAPSDGAVVATWINHATFLLQSAEGNLLTDPVYSERASPLPWIGPKRVHPPGLPFAGLPRIDVVLLSHDHYDHCCLPTLRRLAAAHDPLLITPLGNGPLARRAGLRKIVELDWWQETEARPGLRVTLTPSRHWSNRVSGARNGRLWGGFFLHGPTRRIHFVGDTGYDSALFRKIAATLGSPDLALIPIGAYEPRWFMAFHHCNPEESVRIHRDLGARVSLAMHWGTFPLTDEGRDEPARALRQVRETAGISPETFRVLDPGQSATV